MASPALKLNNGIDMPQVGFGLWKVGNDVCADTVYNAIKAGYRLLDGACDYGNEKECGEGVARAIKDGLVKREDLFIVSKLWPVFHDVERVPQAAKRSLSDWGLDYFDLYLIHFPVALEYVDPAVRYPPGWHVDGKDKVVQSKTTIAQTWGAMEKLVDEGLAKSIGVSNFQSQLLYDLLRGCRIRPATLQIEHHPYLVQPHMIRLCKEEGIIVTAYSSFGPASFDEFGWDHSKAMVPLLKEPTVIEKLAAKHGKTAGQILLRWATQRGLAVIPKSVSEERMKSNLDCTAWDLEQSEIDAITALDKKTKFNMPTNYFDTEKLWIFG